MVIKTIISHPSGIGFYISPYRWNHAPYALAHSPADWRFIGAPGWFIVDENKRIYERIAETIDLEDWHFGEFAEVDLDIPD